MQIQQFLLTHTDYKVSYDLKKATRIKDERKCLSKLIIMGMIHNASSESNNLNKLPLVTIRRIGVCLQNDQK